MSRATIEILESEEDRSGALARYSLGSREDPFELYDSDSSDENPSASKRVESVRNQSARGHVMIASKVLNVPIDARKRPAVDVVKDERPLNGLKSKKDGLADADRLDDVITNAIPKWDATNQSRTCRSLADEQFMNLPKASPTARLPSPSKRCPTVKQPYLSGVTHKKPSGMWQRQATRKPVEVVILDDDSSDSNDTGRAALECEGKSKQNAICILSDDDDDSDEWARGDIRRPSKTVFASKFSQLCGALSPSKRSSPNRANNTTPSAGRRNHATQQPNVLRNIVTGAKTQPSPVVSDTHKGPRRKAILGNTADEMFALGRNGTASFLGRSIQEKGRLKRHRDDNVSSELLDTKKGKDSGNQATKEPDDCSESSEKLKQALSNEEVSTDSTGNRATSAGSGVTEVAEESESESDNETSNTSSDSADSGRTGGGTSISCSWESADEEESDGTVYRSSDASSDFDDCRASDSSEHPMAIESNDVDNADVPVSRQSQDANIRLDVQSSSGFNDATDKDFQGLVLASVTSGSWKDALDNHEIAREQVAFSSSDQRSGKVLSSVSNEENNCGGIRPHADTTAFVRRTTRKIPTRPEAIDSSESLEEKLAAFDPRVQSVKRRAQHLQRKHTRESEASNEEKHVMHLVPHLSKTTYNSSGVPCHKFTVHTNNDDSILYDFEVNIKQSTISKDAGLGAFLVFRGARVLERERRHANSKKMRARQPFDPGTLEKLEAAYQSGTGVLVTLTGKHLHGHNNSIWRAETEIPLKAKYNKNTITVNLVGDHLHYDIDEDEQLGLSCCPTGIGHFRMNTDSEYLLDSSAVFSARKLGNCAVLELGRYGPARKEDRKRKSDFDVKCFFFDQEPAGWCYGLDDPLFGREQIVDITDDATGELHEDARKLPAIYVNEVGHDATLTENVTISQVGGLVQYHIDIQQPMKMGDEVELLCNYRSHYETNRERKGYGLYNLSGAQKSDSDVASKLVRNFAERAGILEMIEALSPLELFYNMEFISQNILPKVDKATSLFAADFENPVPPVRVTPLQILARRRIHWLAPFYLHRIAAIEGFDFLGGEGKDPSSRNVVAEMRKKGQEWAQGMEWRTLLNESRMSWIADQKLKCFFDSETLEEVLFCVKDHFKYPMDVNLWCPIARDLISQICITSFERHLRFRRKVTQEDLGNMFLKCAFKAAEAIRQCITASSYENLAFRSGAEGVWRVKGSPKNLVTLAAGSALSNSTVLKGAISALIDQQVSQQNADLGPNFKVMELTCDEAVVIALSSLENDTRGAMPRPLDFVSERHGTIHEEWYMIWQVVYPAHVILNGLIKEMPETIVVTAPGYDFLNLICHSLNVDVELARSAIEVGIRSDLAAPQMTFTSRVHVGSKGRAPQKTTSKSKTTKSNVNREVAKVARVRQTTANAEKTGGAFARSMFFEIVWKALTDLGWTLLVGNRPTDYYFMPPGVQRGKKFGFKPRVDFFDSYRLVLQFLRTDARWKDKVEVLECLALYDGCRQFLTSRKVKGELKIERIIEQVRLETSKNHLQ